MVNLSRLYEGGGVKPGLPMPTHTTTTIAHGSTHKPGLGTGVGYVGPIPKPVRAGITTKPKASPKSIAHRPAPKLGANPAKVVVTPKPALPGHEYAGTPTPKPVLPGHEAGPRRGPSVTPAKRKEPIAARPLPKANPKPSKPPKPVSVSSQPKPTGGNTNPPKPKSKPAASSATPTSSPFPGTATGGGGFDLASLLPILLIAGAVLAGLYLYTHRKG